MLAKRLPVPPERSERYFRHHEPRGRPGRQGAWRRRGRQPSVGPGGPVRWWERAAPGEDEELWRAVLACHEALRAQGWTITGLAERLRASGWPVRRETLSRILNGRQRTTWPTVERIAVALDVELPPPGASPR